jgi:glycosyltransferase involved in cell wall biosynthesis
MTSERQQRFRVVALLGVRNEELYLERCIKHLISQGIDVCIIDNDSTDRTSEIARSFLGRGVIAVNRCPYPGYYDWRGILRHKETLSYDIDADWFIHHDGDEIREAPVRYRHLKEAMLDVDRKGFNAINFNEFVFVPTDNKESFEGKDYVKEMKYYYFFQPTAKHRVNAWKKTKPINLVDSGGHSADFEDRRLFPEVFILRHYLALSRNHLIAKYVGRVFSPEELRDGWHKKRVGFTPDKIRFPDKEELHLYREDGIWDTTSPWSSHIF